MEGITKHGRRADNGGDVHDGALLAAETAEVADAFAVFYRRYSHAVFLFLAARVRDTQAALDLTAETFCSAYIHRHHYRADRGTGQSWVLGIAHRALVDHQRHDAHESAARRKLGIPRLVYTDTALENAEALIDANRTGYLAALRDLPEHERYAVEARVIDDRAYADIASTEQVSQAVVRKRVSRGLARLARPARGA